MLLGMFSAMLVGFLGALLPAFFMGNIHASFMRNLPAFLVRFLPTFLMRYFLAFTMNLFCTLFNVVAILDRNLLAVFTMMNGLALFLLSLFEQLVYFSSNVALLLTTIRRILLVFRFGHNIQKLSG